MRRSRSFPGQAFAVRPPSGTTACSCRSRAMPRPSARRPRKTVWPSMSGRRRLFRRGAQGWRRQVHDRAGALCRWTRRRGRVARLSLSLSYVAESVRAGSKGVAHASEIPYFLDTVATKYGPATTAGDRAIARTVSAYVVNFVKTGDPNGPGLAAWPRFRGGDVMDFAPDGAARSGNDPWSDRLDLVGPDGPG